MTDSISKASELLNSLYGLPGIMLVFLACIAFGYILRFIKAFPNDGIPVACWLLGGILLPLISAQNESNLRIWIVKNVVLGLFVGFLAWLFHNLLLSRLEDWIASQFPAVKNLLGGDSNNNPPKS